MVFQRCQSLRHGLAFKVGSHKHEPCSQKVASGLWSACARLVGSGQDLFVPPSTIHDFWRQRKISHADAKSELLACRGRGAGKVIAEIDFHAEADARTQLDQTMRQREAVIQKALGDFRNHPTIDRFMLQFNPKNLEGATRFLCLLLRGPSQCGKSQRAEALHGPEATLTVNCQGKPEPCEHQGFQPLQAPCHLLGRSRRSTGPQQQNDLPIGEQAASLGAESL